MVSIGAIDRDVLEELLVIDDAGGATNFKRRLNKLLQRYGVDCWLVTGLQPLTGASAWQSGVLMNAWPEPWYRRYISVGHYRHDPCVARSLRSPHPFAWHEAAGEVSRDRLAERVMAEARSFGLRQGVCVPLHLPGGGASAVVTMAGEAIDDAPGTDRILQLIALKAFWSIAGLHEKSDRPSGLTEREREILQWTAAGKTAWEVGCILDIAETTVIAHLRNVRVKLGTTNIVHTVAEALRLNRIQL